MRQLSVVLAVIAFPVALAAQNREVVQLPGAVPQGLPFSPAIKAGSLVFASGQIGFLPGTRTLAPGGIAAETRQSLENIAAVFQAAGTSMQQAVKCTVFLADIADYAAMNTAYAAAFPAEPPARSTVAVSGLAFGARVEIECIAAA